MTKKKCPSCKKTLSLDKFHYNSRGPLHVSSACKLCNRARNNLRNRALRVKVLSHYSGGTPQCACCGEVHLEFLSLDHINGGGRQHRKTIKIRWWEWLRREGYPEGFRVLCHNCNQSIGLYGYCPHAGASSQLQAAFEKYDEFAPNRSTKLTKAEVLAIRKGIADGIAQTELALRYKVSRATICFIGKRKRWAD